MIYLKGINFHEKIFRKKKIVRFNFCEATKSRYFTRINFHEIIILKKRASHRKSLIFKQTYSFTL